MNPAVHSEARYDSYPFDFEYRPTALEVLRKIRDEADASLAFRESCGLGKCGSCAVMVNGQPVLACRVPLQPGGVVIEPLAGHEIIKDLVVERTDFHDRLREMRAFHPHPDYIRPEEKPIQWNRSFQELNRCIGCLVCESACPSFTKNEAEFPGPALLVQLSRPLCHPLSRGAEEHIAWVDGIHNCTACMNCTNVCPKDIDPFRNAILPLRTAISDNRRILPNMQEGLSKQYLKSGKLVPLKHEKLTHEAIDPNSKTAMFLGCMMGDRYANEGRAVLDLLSAMGIKARVPKEMVCCGGPLMWVGKSNNAEEAFERNLDILLSCEVERIITPCTGCSLTFKKDYSDFYRQKTGKNLPFTVVDITEILNDMWNQIDFKTDRPLRAVYHSPCHGGAGHRRLEESLKTGNVCGIEMMGAKDLCCGGMTSSSNPSLAFEMSSNIIDEAQTAGADALITACIFCRDNLSRAVRRKRSHLKVEHILLFLAKQLNST